ncbi:hypothetical protein FACS1894181_03740 [Bacteroidia bacterium]|nr:hypothetical protein FACS1894181_03740 [Bacteroidia bacterium]
MFGKLSKEQLEKLALYTAGINSILVEALLASPSPESEDGEGERNVEVEIFIVEKDKEPKSQK